MKPIVELIAEAQGRGIVLALENGKVKFKIEKGTVIDPSFIDILRERKNDIQTFLFTFELENAPDKKLDSYKNDSTYSPLSFAQERLWIIDKLEGSVHYHLVGLYKASRDIEVDGLSYSLQRIVERHDVLRTVFVEKDNKVFQQVISADHWTINIDDSILNNADSAIRKVKADLEKPFNLTSEIPVRSSIVRLSSAEFIVGIAIHHIASDGWSQEIFIRELREIYSAWKQGRPPVLTPLSYTYSQFAIWEKENISGKFFAAQLGYWENKLRGVTPLGLTTDLPRPSRQSIKGNTFRVQVPHGVLEKLSAMSKSKGVTMFTTLLATFKVLLYRHTAQIDICVGSPVANRTLEEVEPLMGFFANTVPLRTSLKSEDGKFLTFNAFLGAVKTTILDAYHHQSVPFEKIVERVERSRESGRSPIFQVVFAHQNNRAQHNSLDFGNATITKIEHVSQHAKFDLTFTSIETDSGLDIEVEYCTDLFFMQTVRRMVEQYMHLLSSVSESSSSTVDCLELFPEAERTYIETGLNATEKNVENTTTIAAFEEQVKRTPHSIAIVHGNERITYHDLNRKSNALAYDILGKNLPQGALIGVCLDRSIEMMISIFGIMKAGAAYIPIDYGYPEDRIRYMIEDSGASLLLTTGKHVQRISKISQCPVVTVDAHRIESNIRLKNPRIATSESAIYVIYTSGTTGKPKGSVVRHRNFWNLLNWFVDCFEVSKEDAILMITSLSFDLTQKNLFAPLIKGGRLVITSSDIFDPNVICNEINAHSISIVNCTPGMFYRILDDDLSGYQRLLTLRKVFLGGEPINKAKLRQWATSNGICTDVYNTYGPTECADICLSDKLEWNDDTVLLGNPVYNSQIYILDEQLQLVPRGAVGELCVAGGGVGVGYLNRPELTEQKFITNPFTNKSALYRTGDLGRWTNRDKVEYLGRRDDQVKVRGYRIELAEIETALQTFSGIRQSVVIAREDENEHKRLVAYIVPDGTLDREAVRQYLRKQLPEYMIPVQWVELSMLPMTPNGKIDKRNLPDPGSILPVEEYVQATSAIELLLVDIWKELLGIDRVGINTNFFEAGGDSITTIQMVSRLRQHGFTLSPRDIFQYQSIKALSGFLLQGNAVTRRDEHDVLTGACGLLPIQQFFFEQSPEGNNHFNQSVFLQIDKKVPARVVHEAISLLVTRHDALRFRYNFNGTIWEQSYGTATLELEIIELVDLSDLLHECDRLQQGLSITAGRLIRVALITTPSNESHNRILFVIHHLAIDSVSWRILLQDFSLIIDSISSSQTTTFRKGNSYRQWFEYLNRIVTEPSVFSSLGFWEKTISAYRPLLPSNTDGKVYYNDLSEHIVKLDVNTTSELLRSIHQTHNTDVSDILLSALLLVVQENFGMQSVVVGLESHGRAIAKDIDISDTVGWFTSLYPVHLQAGSDMPLELLLKSVKEQLRHVPSHGLSFGLLKYLHSDPNIRQRLSGRRWDIVFNYLGQFDNVLPDHGVLRSAREFSGHNISPNFNSGNKLEIVTSVQSGELAISIWHCTKSFQHQRICDIGEGYVNAIRRLVHHCQSVVPSSTPYDHGLAPEVEVNSFESFMKTMAECSAIRMDSVEDVYRLTAMQEGMLYHEFNDHGSFAYKEQFMFELSNGVDIDAFGRSWNEILDNHTILRTSFHAFDLAVPVQCVHSNVNLPIDILDYSNFSLEIQQHLIGELLAADLQKGFDFERPPLMRISLIHMGGLRWKFLLTFHHIILDGWSFSSMMYEFLLNYSSNGKKRQQSKVCEKFNDYVKFISRQDHNDEKIFWEKYFEDYQSQGPFPLIKDLPIGNKNQNHFLHSEAVFNKHESFLIFSFCQNNRITVNTLIQGVWALILSRYLNAGDVVFGATVSGRPSELDDVEKRVGLFINTLPLRVKIDESLQLSTWLTSLQDNHSQSREYQYTALSEIKKWTRLPGGIFDTILVFENYPVQRLEEILSQPGGLKIELQSVHEQTNYPLTLIVGLSDRVSIKLSYNSSLIDSYYAKKICDHFSTLVNQLIREKDLRVCDLEILSLSEREEILNYHQGATVENLSGRSIIDLLEAQFLLQGEKICLVYEDTRLSYSELNKRCNELGNMLRLGYGVKKGDRIGVLMNRSEWSAICMISIMKLGCVYVPLDPTYPSSRLEYMISNSGVGLLLTHGTVVAGEDELFSGIKRVEVSKELLTGQYSDLNIGESVEGHLCSYVIYTSGSTGLPKGVEQTYEMLYNLITWDVERSGMGHGRRHLQYSSFSFDSSLHDIYYCLITGGEVHILSDACRKDMWSLKDYVIGEGIETLSMPYSALKVLYDVVSEEDLSGHQIKEIISTGEQLYISGGLRDFLQHHPSIRIHNLYGPSETHVITGRHYSFSEGAVPVSATIGKSVDNTHLYIVDKQNRLCPLGCVGELYAGGSNLALGYSANASGTSARFIDNPFRPGEKVYKTGDLCRWLLDGDIEYLGRIDDQVKIRGYRIELGEIETVLQQYGGVSQSVVLAKSDSTGGKRLIGYVVKEGDLDREDLQNHLRKYLPDYMIPSAFVRMDSFPLTSNGKIDKRSLPDSDPELSGSAYVAPRTEVEEKLAKIWSSILDLPYESISATSDFFDLGGHSLLSMRLCSWIRKGLSVEISIKDIFGHSKLSALALFIENKERTTYRPLGVIARPSRIPLSYSQERLWFIDRLQGSVNYHVPVILRLMGDLDGMILEKSLQGIVDRHEILRTVYGETDGEAYQEVQSSSAWNLSRKKLRESELLFAIDEIVSAPFDLSKDYMLRGVLVEVDSSSHVLVLVTHHIATDGWSQGIFVDELVSQYEHHQQGKPLRPGLSYQYIDYALWQRDHLSGALLDEKLGYWTSKLSGIQPLDLPTDFSRPAIQSTRGSVYNFTISADLHSGLQSLSQSTGSTLFMTLLSAFKVLLYRYSGQYDISVGSPIAGRTQKELETMIGFFVNTLVLRSNLEGNPRFLDVLHSVKSTTLEAYDHQEVPFEKIVERVEQSRDMSRSPLFQVMFVLQNIPDSTVSELIGLNISELAHHHLHSRYDITFGIENVKTGELSVTVEYCTDLYNRTTIAQLCAHYVSILTGVVVSPSTRIDSLEMLTAEEKTMLVDKFNATSVSYPAGKTLLDLFYTQASLTPDGIAVRYEDRSISYRELDEKSNQLSHYLLKAGVRTESLVGICIERSIEMIIGLFGILKSGGAYVPVDPEYPVDRIEYMLSDSQVSLVLTSEKEWSLVKGTGADVIRLDSDWSLIEAEPVEGCGIRVSDSDLAYVIYTSGSTGRPKGVMITHGNVYEFLMWSRQEFSQSNFEIVYGVTSICFDLSVFEIFYTLTTGRPLKLMSSLDISKHLSQDKNILLNTVPSVIGSLLEEDLRTVTVINMAGEPIPPRVVEGLDLDRIEVRNLYGPSEDTTYSSRYRVREKSKVFIGRPISNTSMYILDGRLNLLPIGVSGELYISGKGLSRGYLNQPELTSTRFIANPFIAGQMLYKTGDLCRWLLDGDIEYLGRIDDQVKIRGYRIELGEIETVLQQYGGVSQSVVLAKSDSTGGKRLVGYVVKEGDLDREDLQNHLRKYLPDYMIPSAFVRMDSFPLTSNGKIDKRSLPDSDPELSGSAYVAPRTTEEKNLGKIWCELLGLQKIGVHDNFFAMGGDSIVTIQLVSRARKKGYQITPKDIFETQTIFGLALRANKNTLGNNAEQGMLTGESMLTPIQQHFFEQVPQCEKHYNQGVLFQIDKRLASDQVSAAVTSLIEHHDALRFTYSFDGCAWHQHYGSMRTVFAEQTIGSTENCGSEIEQICTHAQQSLDPLTGDIFRAILIRMPDEHSSNRLFLVSHHLAIDAVSWRIIIEQLEEDFVDLMQGMTIRSRQKGNSFREWSYALQEFSQTDFLRGQLKHWEIITSKYSPLPVDMKAQTQRTYSTLNSAKFKLEKPHTLNLLRSLQGKRKISVEDVLLTSLAYAIGQWTGDEHIVVGLEGHGRESINENIDTTATVGWFTSLYPIVLQTRNIKQSGLRDVIDSVKAEGHSPFNKGLEYGLLRHFNGNGAVLPRCWDVLFNYLGQMDSMSGIVLKPAEEYVGPGISPTFPVNEKMIISAAISNEELLVSIEYSHLEYHANTINMLGESYIQTLRDIILARSEMLESPSMHSPKVPVHSLLDPVTIQEISQLINSGDLDGNDIMRF